jgi:multiple sugar transport system ATP-binding protein
MNLAHSRVERTDDGGLALVIGAADRATRLQLPADKAALLGGYAGKAVIAGIRPEAVTLASAEMAASATQQFLQAKVEVVEPTGADTLALLDLGGAEFTARLEPDVAVAPGQSARFLVDLAKLVCFDPESETLVA